MSTATAQRLQQAPLVPERMPVDNRPGFFAALEADDKPVILTGAMRDWPAERQWTFDWFAREYGDVSAPVEWLQYGRRASGGVERVGRVRNMTIRDYVALLKSSESAEAGYLIGKDLFQLQPRLRGDVKFSEYAVERRLTEQLFFMGPRGTFTQLHMDRAHNLHAVMVGRKQWQLYAPSREAELDPMNLDHVWSVVSGHDLVPGGGNPDALPGGCVPDYDFVLEAGEMLYLPYGWWHRVYTVETAIATNYWWWTWPMLARIGPRLIPSLAFSVLGRMRKQSVHGRRFREQ
ncbi:cupin-like domain-containing protein [Pyxidicoccus fallax]|uniref:Cupin-like domain-containing protein n=1 Tax=Pyxidicoccus fallax TaxID=394095 RepID=A0A848LX50_9BACT|nr:cupin-like domain-containing protein [Pyxidicoccus fallax]NMO22180.1 cupin-like domain-containing protein [Pyxidicoccus fallax]NPC84127.1 cupin-like domain-containing protein [Pyxidicoccus fallax]